MSQKLYINLHDLSYDLLLMFIHSFCRQVCTLRRQGLTYKGLLI